MERGLPTCQQVVSVLGKFDKRMFSETIVEEACESTCVYKRIGDFDLTNEYCFVPLQGGIAECMVRTFI